ncbi:MAG TPA: Ig-like domain-containing protein [Candidatus Thermoplasmatota archaeon]
MLNKSLLNRELVVVMAIAFMSLGAIDGMASSTTPDAPTFPACATTPAVNLTGSISGVTYDCGTEVHVKGITTISSGHLRFLNTTVVFDGPYTLRVGNNAKLTINNSVLQPNTTADRWGLEAQTGSKVEIVRSTIEGLTGVVVSTRDFKATDLTVDGTTHTAFSLAGGRAVLNRVAINDAPSAFTLRSNAEVLANNLTVGNTNVAGFDVQGSWFNATDVLLTTVANPLLVTAGGKVRLDNITLQGTATQATVGTQSSRLDLYGTVPAWSVASFTFLDDTGLVNMGRIPTIRVVDEAQGVPVVDATVEVRRIPSEAPFATATTDSQGYTTPIRVLDRTLNLTLDTVQPEPTLFVKKAHNSGSLVPLMHSQWDWVVELPTVPDNTPPSWATETPLAANPYTWNGTALITWAAATDPGTATNAVSHYALYRFPTTGTSGFVRNVYGLSTYEPLGEAGPVTYRVKPVDLSGNLPSAFSNPVAVTSDPDPPWLNVTRLASAGPDPNWFNATSVTQWANATDNMSGIRSVVVKLPGSNSFVTPPNPITITTIGTSTFVYRLEDNAGHELEVVVTTGIDRSDPETGPAITPAAPNGNNGWYNTNPTLTVAGSDTGSGIFQTRYRLGQGPWTPFTTTTNISTPGQHILFLEVKDHAGNADVSQAALKIDSAVPTLTATWTGTIGEGEWYRSPVKVNLTATDLGSGVAERGYRTPTIPWTRTDTEIVFDRNHNTNIEFRAVDQAGNAVTTPAKSLRVDLDAPLPAVLELVPRTSDTAKAQLDWSKAPPVDAMSGIARLELLTSIDNQNYEKILTLPATANQTTVPTQIAPKQWYLLRAVDHAGWTEDSNPIALAAPSAATLLSANDKPPVFNGPTTIHADPVDPENVTSVSFFLDGVLQKAVATPPYSITIDPSALSSGEHNVQMVIAHANGLVQQETRVFEVRNDYVSRLQEHPLSVPLIGGIGLLGTLLGSVGLVRARRWRLA